MRALTKYEMAEMKTQRRPTQAATETIKAMCILLGEKPVKLDFMKATMSIEKVRPRAPTPHRRHPFLVEVHAAWCPAPAKGPRRVAAVVAVVVGSRSQPRDGDTGEERTPRTRV